MEQLPGTYQANKKLTLVTKDDLWGADRPHCIPVSEQLNDLSERTVNLLRQLALPQGRPEPSKCARRIC